MPRCSLPDWEQGKESGPCVWPKLAKPVEIKYMNIQFMGRDSFSLTIQLISMKNKSVWEKQKLLVDNLNENGECIIHYHIWEEFWQNMGLEFWMQRVILASPIIEENRYKPASMISRYCAF